MSVPEYTSEGLTIQTFDEILEDYKDIAREVFGEEVNLTPKSVMMEFLSKLAEREQDVQQLVQVIHAQQDPATASGVGLDKIGAIRSNIDRLTATASRVLLVIAGTEDTVIDTDFIARVRNTQNNFQVEEEVTIGEDFQMRIVLDADLITGNTFACDVDGNAISEAFDTDHDTTMAAIVAAIDAIANVTAAIVDDGVGRTIDVTGALALPEITGEGVTGGDSQAGVTVSAIVKVYAECTTTGPVQARAGTLTEIVTPVAGVDSVTNDLDATLGTDIETDAAYLARQEESLEIAASGTVEAIRAAVAAIEGVDSVSVVENVEDEEDEDGRPSGSLEVIVDSDSGDTDLDQAIADTISGFKTGNGGRSGGARLVSTVNTVSKTVTDSQGIDHTVVFSRPDQVEIYHDITLTVDGDYPADGDDLVKAAILAYGATLGVGDDVLHYKHISAIAGADIPGILDIEVALNTTGDPVTETANIVIGANERAVFDSARIAVAS